MHLKVVIIFASIFGTSLLFKCMCLYSTMVWSNTHSHVGEKVTTCATQNVCTIILAMWYQKWSRFHILISTLFFSQITRDVFTSSLSELFSYLFLLMFLYFKHFAQCVCLFGMCVCTCVCLCVWERGRDTQTDLKALSVSGSIPNDTLSSL